MSAQTILKRCDVLAGVTADPGRITRAYLTPEHAQANSLTAGWMRQAGLVTWQDAAGNQRGRLEGSRPGLPALVLGSHLDTVPNAGKYDGILGVMVAIDVAARWRKAAPRLPFALEVVAFGDEEGARFGATLLGSSALAGTWDASWWELRDKDGVRLVDAFADFGLSLEDVSRASLNREDAFGYLEVHIEQGPILERANRPLGLVTSIAGARRLAVTITGQAGHAGSAHTSRRDALAGAAEAIFAVESLAPTTGVLATVGRINVEPSAVNVVPGRATFSLDVRADSDAARDRGLNVMLDQVKRICRRRNLDITVATLHQANTVVCAEHLKAALAHGVCATGENQPLSLFSPAGHDAMAMAAVTDVAMMFVRCGEGLSHHPDESVLAEDIDLAIDALDLAIGNLARHAPTASVPGSRGASTPEAG